MKLSLRRTRWASDDLKKNAMKIPDVLRKSKDRLKNVFRDELGNVQAKIHVQQQDIKTIGTKNFTATRKTVAEQTSKKLDMMEQMNKFLYGKRKLVSTPTTSDSNTTTTVEAKTQPPTKKIKQ